MSSGFVHLRVHTEYSLSDSVVRIAELVAATAAAGMPAVAVTDQNNLFAMVKFYREALKCGIKPLIGVDLCVREEGERAPPSRLTLLCQTPEGYRNLTRLVSRAYLEGQERGVPRIERSWLTLENCGGLIALSGAADGDVGRALCNAREADAERLLAAWLALVPTAHAGTGRSARTSSGLSASHDSAAAEPPSASSCPDRLRARSGRAS